MTFDIKTILRTISRFFTILFGIGSSVIILNYFGIEPFKDSLLFFLSVTMNVWIVFELILYITGRRKGTLTSHLIKELQELSINKEYQKILRYRQNLSRSLWIEGKPQERIKLGEIAEDAAVKLGDKKTQAEILIDDLGWTQVTIGEYKKAMESIVHGRTIAKSIPDMYLSAKANRHLAGIEFERKRYDKAISCLKKALKFANRVTHDKLKLEMLGGIEYAFALIYTEQQNHGLALEYISRAEEFFRDTDDKERWVKTFSVKGQIAENNSNYSLAKDCYREGLAESEDIGRIDEQIRNHLGLARLYKLEYNQAKYLEHKKTADRLIKGTPIPYKIDDKSFKLKKLK